MAEGSLAKLRVIRALLIRVLGVFIIFLATYLTWGVEGRLGYLFILATSVGATLLIVSSFKRTLLGRSFDARSPPIPLLLAAGGAILGVEGLLLQAVFNEEISAYYALVTLGGSLTMLWGNYNPIRVKMLVLRESRVGSG